MPSITEKALQIAHLRAIGSVSERAVVRVWISGSREARAGRSSDELAQLRVLDRRRPFGSLACLFQGSFRRGFERGIHALPCGFRKPPRSEPQLPPPPQP